METVTSRRKKYLKFIKDQFAPSFVYYPGVSFDCVPKETFGEHKVIHLFHLEDNKRDLRYSEAIGDGIKLYGDMFRSPLADESVDAILCYPCIPSKELQHDIERILKPHGIVSIEGCGYLYANRLDWNECYEQFQNYKRIELPKEFHSGQNLYGIHKDEETALDGWYVGTEEEMKGYVTSHKGYSGFNEILDYAIFQKP